MEILLKEDRVFQGSPLLIVDGKGTIRDFGIKDYGDGNPELNDARRRLSLLEGERNQERATAILEAALAHLGFS